jgi:nucleoside phosphorylase
MREELRRGSPDRVLTCGFAGGLNPALETGALVAAWRERWPDPAGLTAAGFRPVRFVSSERMVVTAGEKRRLREQTGADAVEMESDAIQRVCAEHGVPAATLRVISDSADEDLPLDFNALSDADWNLDPARLALALARAPRKIADLVRFHRRIRAAAASLAAALGRVTGIRP